MSQPPQSQDIVLSVDDDADAHILLNMAFAKAGLTVPLSTLSEGGEAIHYLAGEGKFADRKAYPLPKVLLLDLKMPLVSANVVITALGNKRGSLTRLPK
jgi:CheY-like chemotaxis protein